MKKKSLLLLFSFLLIGCLTVGFSEYVILGLNINDTNGDFNVEQETDKENFKKVTFSDSSGSVLKTMYFEKNEYVTLNDAPSDDFYEYDSSGNLRMVKWTSGNNILSIENDGATNGISVTQDLNFVKNTDEIIVNANGTPAGDNQTTFDDSSFEKENTYDGNVVYGNNNKDITFQEGNNSNKNEANEISLNEPIINGANISTTFKDQDGNENLEQNIAVGSGEYQHTNDTTIGLEDPSSKEIIALNENEKFYKPNTNSSTVYNPCISRIRLDSDTSLLGGSTLNIGARVGYYNGGGWSQMNWQGFINGSYNELDLNGHTLIIGKGSTLKLFGSLTDSVGTGQIIVMDGGTIITTFIIEDQSHERHMPVAYLYGDSAFSMYRAPYLNASIKVYSGGTVTGQLKIDFGGDNNANMYQENIGMIGKGSNFMIDMTDSPNDSYVIRNTIYDEDMFNYIQSETVSKNNIFYQKIKYEIYGGNIEVRSPSFYEFTISTITFNLNPDRTDTFIPPYFHIYLYDTDVTVRNNLIFYPGSYLYANQTSNINLSAGNWSTFDLPVGAGLLMGIGASDRKLPDIYQNVGGLMFVNQKFDFRDALKWIDDKDDTEAGSFNGSLSKVYSSTTKLWSYQSNHYSAKADIYGQFNFDNSVALYKENYHLGGEINIYNISNFVTKVNSTNRVNLYNSVFDGANNWFQLVMDGKIKFNVQDYYAYPMVSEGNVLMDMSQNNKVRSDYLTETYTLNFDTGIISHNNDHYVPIYTDLNGLYNNWANHLNKCAYKYEEWRELEDWTLVWKNNLDDWKNMLDDLRVVFYKVNVSNNIVTVEGTSLGGQYIYFHGGFFKYDSTNQTVDISKFTNEDSNYPDSNKQRKVIYDVSGNGYYDHGAWRLQ